MVGFWIVEAAMIREMLLSDIDGIVDVVGRRMFAESAFRDLDYDESKSRLYLSRIICGDRSFGCVAEVDGEVVGFFTGYVSEYFFGRDLIATEELWYVVPGHRSSALGLGLLGAFEDWARGMGVREVCVGLSTGNDPARVGGILERRGYRQMGGVYKLPVVG